ncbi:uncharacterized protein LOC144172521 [Haemaphysalis longicornis]
MMSSQIWSETCLTTCLFLVSLMLAKSIAITTDACGYDSVMDGYNFTSRKDIKIQMLKATYDISKKYNESLCPYTGFTRTPIGPHKLQMFFYYVNLSITSEDTSNTLQATLNLTFFDNNTQRYDRVYSNFDSRDPNYSLPAISWTFLYVGKHCFVVEASPSPSSDVGH